MLKNHLIYASWSHSSHCLLLDGVCEIPFSPQNDKRAFLLGLRKVRHRRLIPPGGFSKTQAPSQVKSDCECHVNGSLGSNDSKLGKSEKALPNRKVQGCYFAFFQEGYACFLHSRIPFLLFSFYKR